MARTLLMNKRNWRYRTLLNAGPSGVQDVDTAQTNGTSSSGTPLAVNIPATVADGMLMIMFINRWTAVHNNTPTGWTKIAALDGDYTVGSDDMSSRVFWKIASSEAATIDVDATDVSGRRTVASVIVLTGFHADKWDVTPTSSHTQGLSNTKNPTASPITTVTDSALILRWMVGSEGAYTTHGMPAGYDSLEEISQSDGNLTFGSATKTTAGSDEPGVWQHTGGSANSDITECVLAIKPE